MNRTPQSISNSSVLNPATTFHSDGDASYRQVVRMEACVTAVLRAVNRHFGTDFGLRNIVGQPFRYGGAMNLNLTTMGLPDGRPDSLHPGRYPLSFLTWLTGCGPTLHITRPDWVNQGISSNRMPAASTFGGWHGKTTHRNRTLTLFRAHIDSAYAYHPAGFVAHLLVDVLYFGQIHSRIRRSRGSMPHR